MPRKDSDRWDRDHIPEMGLKTPKMRLRPPQERGQTSGTVLNSPRLGLKPPRTEPAALLKNLSPPSLTHAARSQHRGCPQPH